MPLHRRIKYQYYRRQAKFPYFGEVLHFPPDSIIFAEACASGIYEPGNLRLLQCAARPDTWYYDIGANIGLMSAPLLASEPALTVVSVEASPVTAPCLARSMAASAHQARWQLVPKALGESPGRITFYASAAGGGVYDGLRNTGRAGGGSEVEVEMTTLDLLWQSHGCPSVSIIKLDIEGAETHVLRGAKSCLRATRPIILLEWNPVNLAAYGFTPESLLSLAQELGYGVHTTPGLAAVENAAVLPFLSRVNETFLLLPCELAHA